MHEPIPDTEKIRTYYDGYATAVQQRTGVNIRHRAIMRRLERSGLRSTDRILEIGCGIGTLTDLIASRNTRGVLIAADISPQAIDSARSRLKRHQHVSFLVSDMSDFRSDVRFNHVILPDVLEHIPMADHDRLFATIAAHLAPQGRVSINIPDPFALDWMRAHRPELLQIIDQSLHVADIANKFSTHSLRLDRFERYRLWHNEPEYNWIEFARVPASLALTRRSYLTRLLDNLLRRPL